MPPSATVGGPALTLSVRGTSILSNSTIGWNGTTLATTSQSDGSGSFVLSATVPVADIAAMGTAQVTVTTPGAGNGTSSGKIFTITKPQTVAYVPDYRSFMFNSIDFSGLSAINYFSIKADSAGTLATTSSLPLDFSYMDNLVTAAHAANPPVPVSITVDPGTPFQAIADNTDSPTAASDFVTAIVKFCGDHHLDGIDMDYEPGTLTSDQMNSYGQLLSMLHVQTSAHGLLLSAAVQVSQHIIPQAYLSSLDRYYVMDYDLEYYNSAPYSDATSYLDSWASYGVPKSELWMGIPFYGTGGTSWSDATQKTYGDIFSQYNTAHGSYPPAGANDEVVGGTDWGYTGIVTAQAKATYAIENGYAGTMIWDLGQDHFDSNTQYDQHSLFPGLKAAMSGTIPMAFANSNTITLKRDSDGRHIDWSTGTTANSWSGVFAIADLDGLTINGAPGNNTIALDYSAGNPLPNIIHLNGTFTVNGLTGANPLANTKLDIGQSTVFINYANAGADTATKALIKSSLAGGYNSGAWTGVATASTGVITSTAAKNDVKHNSAIGWADSSDGSGVNTTSNTIELKYTLNGDTNLNGATDIFDLNNLLPHFNKTGDWTSGDFTYNGNVDIFDLNALLPNFNMNLGAQVTPATPDTTPPAGGPAVDVVSAPVSSASSPTTNLASTRAAVSSASTSDSAVLASEDVADTLVKKHKAHGKKALM